MPGLIDTTGGLRQGSGLYWHSGLTGGPGLRNTLFLAGATLDMNFTSGAYLGATPANLTVTRAGTNATDLTYDQTGRTSYNSFSANTLRNVADGRGMLVEESRTQYLGVTDAPATQTTSSLGTGSYTLWVIGAGSAAVSAGTATITGAGSATAGTPLTFTVTVAGTVVVTKTGSLTFFQLENGAFATSYIPNAGAAGSTSTRNADAVSLAFSMSMPLSAYVEGITSKISSANQIMLDINDGTLNNRLAVIQILTTGAIQSGYTVSGVGQAPVVSGYSATGNAVTKAAIAAANSDHAITANNTSVVSNTTTGLTGINKITMGSNSSTGAVYNGFIRRVAYFPSRLGNTTLQAITA